MRRLVTHRPGLFYAGSVCVLAAIVLAWVVSAGVRPMAPGMLALLAVLGAFPATDLAIRLVNFAVTHLLPARSLPRLALTGGVPADGKTLIVMPIMLTSMDEIAEYCERLEVHFLANPDPAFRFALLSDWADAPTEEMGNDRQLLLHARNLIATLNTRHVLAGDERRFYLFHRRRCWSVGENCWMGWERKRGKLVELNSILSGKPTASFCGDEGRAGAPVAIPRNVQYVVTLDGDTRVPIGGVRRLLGAALHPLNRPRWNANGTAVECGFGVLQPRVTPLLPEHGGRSLYQWATSGTSGMDPYAGAVSDVYQDLFGEGIFTGKGLYHLETFRRAIANRVPDNAVLSHDLLEGRLARCGLVTDVEVYEEFPSHSEVAAARSHRWTRGDWQLLPWLTTRHMWLSHRIKSTCRESIPARFLLAHRSPGCNCTSNQV
jgi:cyclic beta-1,2-glucan synthetase